MHIQRFFVVHRNDTVQLVDVVEGLLGSNPVVLVLFEVAPHSEVCHNGAAKLERVLLILSQVVRDS
jgi:hypothetical protein